MSDSFQFFAQIIERELGIVYGEANRYQLEQRLAEVVKSEKLRDTGQLMLKYKSSPNQLRRAILDLATNNETMFFRDPKLFKVINDHVFPRFEGKKLKVWSAACSSGQEPFSLGIMHLEDPKARDFSIFATDISGRVLKKAAAADYSGLEIARGLSTDLIERYFDKNLDQSYRPRAPLRNLVRFETHNLLDRLPSGSQFDLIFCRNVLIYQSVETKRAVLNRMVEHLNPGGFLALGAGESLLGVTDAFKLQTIDGSSIYQLPARVAVAA